jgi:hypothetical protein
MNIARVNSRGPFRMHIAFRTHPDAFARDIGGASTSIEMKNECNMHVEDAITDWT